MEEDRKLSPREREIINRDYNKSREYSEKGAENQNKETPRKGAGKRKDAQDRHRADMNGNTGKFETEHTHPLDDSSAAPGAEEKDEAATSASGAGLGGNKGTGTRNKKDFT